MFFRIKPAGTYRYLQIAHSVREGKKVRQQVIATLGQLDLLQASGQLDRLMRWRRAPLPELCRAGCPRRLGPDLVFGRLWQESDIPEALGALLGRPALGA
jgi:hypothetical protein